MGQRTLANGAYAPGFQGRRQRVDRRLVAAVAAVVPLGATVLDIGCGFGCLVRGLRERGYEAFGVDGTPGIAALTDGLVDELDLSGPVIYSRTIAWGVCTEVGEHIPREHESQLLDNLAKLVRVGLILTWADEGSRGYGHVNCRSPVYVASELARRRLFVDEQATRDARAHVRPKYRSRLMVVRHG